MIIERKKIISLMANVPLAFDKTMVIPSISLKDVSEKRLKEIGFNVPLKAGDTILPSDVGPKTRENAEGKETIRRDLPKEKLYREQMWRYKQWHGKERIEVETIVSVPYERYPREWTPPQSLELTVGSEECGRIELQPVLVDFENPEKILFSINLMLELFGQCELLDSARNALFVHPVHRLNWVILPPGENPWLMVEAELPRLLRRVTINKKEVFQSRFKRIESYSPDYWVMGKGGFSGYLVAVFSKRGFAVLECARYGNATYILRNEWKQVSQMTKAQILDQDLHEARLVHLESWAVKLDSMLRKLSA